jgi:hypothetical protein
MFFYVGMMYPTGFLCVVCNLFMIYSERERKQTVSRRISLIKAATYRYFLNAFPKKKQAAEANANEVKNFDPPYLTVRLNPHLS